MWTRSPGSLRPKLSRTLTPENRFWIANEFAFCGQKDLALRLLKGSVAGHYCAYTGLQNDPMLANLRGTPEFGELLSAAKLCRDDFLAQRPEATH